MSADIEFERRVRSELRIALDRAEGPHRGWATSPAAAIVATGLSRSSRAVPWRVLAVAAVLVLGSLAAAILARPDLQQDAGVPGCPTLADYAPAFVELPPDGTAPGVTFPPVAPRATMTTGLLQPGDWAVIANADGPGLEIRVRDVRECGRLPDLRSSHEGGSIYLATVDAQVLRDNTRLAWIPRSLLRGAVGARLGELDPPPPYSVPGADDRTHLELFKGFAVTTTYVLDVPPTDALITLDHPGGDPGATLPGLGSADLASGRARWVVRDGEPAGEPFSVGSRPSPGATPTIGEIRLGEDVSMMAPDGPAVIRLSDVYVAVAYPGLAPAPGHVFVEIRVTKRDASASGLGSTGWGAIDGDGRGLPIIDSALLPGFWGWGRLIVVEADELGPIRLEYHHQGAADGMFWVRLRD